DAAQLAVGGTRIALTTDSYVVSPLFFPGGDIGDLAVNGTVNDLSVAGARPLYLSAGFILEEGFPIADLQRVTESMRAAAEAAGVHVVTGDTKVVQKGKADGCYINTAGVGVLAVEDAIPVRPEVRGASELLGIDPMYVACEGRLVAVVPGEDADRAVAALAAHPLGEQAAVIGRVRAEQPGIVQLKTAFGGT